MGVLEGKTSIITGGGRGIGKQIAITFAKEGSKVALIDIDIERAEKTAEEIRKMDGKAFAYRTDISNLGEVESMVKWILDKTDEIDILVNNAGVTQDNLIIKMTEQQWDKVLNINLKGAFNCCKTIARYMLKQRKGRIINIASIIGIIGNIGQVNYAASKAGLIALTKTLAKEFASRGINVNAIAPGFIKTQMTEKLPEEVKKAMLSNIPLGRFGEPSDVANVALFLAGNLSKYITGQVIVVDGGMILS
jgi:3-oxoacyl-[acyl-carrier protein] reductase